MIKHTKGRNKLVKQIGVYSVIQHDDGVHVFIVRDVDQKKTLKGFATKKDAVKFAKILHSLDKELRLVKRGAE